MSVSEKMTQAACTTVSTSLAITDAPAMMGSTWNMTGTTVWVSKGEGMWVGVSGGEEGVFSISHFPGKGGK